MVRVMLVRVLVYVHLNSVIAHTCEEEVGEALFPRTRSRIHETEICAACT